MANSERVSPEGPLQLELTAPAIQRLARKGCDEQLSDEERTRLCECVVFHIDAILAERRIPKALKPQPPKFR